MKSKQQLQDELESFSDLWHGGTNLAKKGWDKSAAESIYLDHNGVLDKCIKPFIKPTTTVLEIGAGGGGWTIKMVGAGKVICFDALSAKHNKFWKRIGRKPHVNYFQVEDFSCKELEDNSIDYVFSYDVFCHISYSGARAYLQNLYPKLKNGANCFIMVADAAKYSDKNARRKQCKVAGFKTFKEVVQDCDGLNSGGRWYFYADKFYQDLTTYGYEVVNRDVGLDKLSPIIHFIKK